MRASHKIYKLLTPKQRRSLAPLLACMVIGMVLETLGIGVVVPAIAVLTRRDLAASYPLFQPFLVTLGNPTQTQLVVGAMLALVAINAIRAVFLAFMAWRQTKFAFDLHVELSQRLFTMYLRQPYAFLLRRNSAQLIRNATTEVAQLISFGILPAMIVLTEALVLVGMAALLLVVEPLSAVAVVFVMGAAAWGLRHTTRTRLARWGLARQHHAGLCIQYLQEGLGGAKEVKLLGRESYFLARYHQHNVENARIGEYQNTLNQLPRVWLELLGVAGLATLVLTMLAQGRDMARIVPALGLFGTAAFRLMPSVNRLLAAVQSLRFGLAAVDIVYEELSLAAEPALAAKTSFAFRSTIELADVTYVYPGAVAPALNRLSITINKGESVGFVGPSGSGKSTLVDIVLGLLTPTAGQVRVDGGDIQPSLRGWQDQVGYVPQSIYLTDDTLRRNVAFGLTAAQIDEAAVQRAIKAAQLEEFVASLPDGIETIVGERGVRLSGGQRQRIGVARALYHDPAVLVLDEATSALDIATERGVMEAVEALHGIKTILIVAHRPSTVERCDRLYRLEQGSVVEAGSVESVIHAATH